MRVQSHKYIRYLLCLYCLLPSMALAVDIPANLLIQLQKGLAVDIIVEYDSAQIEQTAKSMRKKKPRAIEDDEILNFRRTQYKTLKDNIDKLHDRKEMTELKSYSHLPSSFKRFKTKKALKRYLASSGVKAVYENKRYYRVLNESLPLISQPAVGLANAKGAGTTVAVIDDGIQINHAAFGACTSPNTPANNCKVIASVDFADTPNTASAHGTNVSATVLGVAPETKIAMLNVFSGSDASASDIIDAINWSIANKATYNIQAMNLSLGANDENTANCTFAWFTAPFQNARSAGISIVVASGNSAFSNGIASPACAPEVISVGAVYDANIGGVAFTVCQDATTMADKVTCFSNSATILTMLAPGAPITAGGVTQYGTSQASPHVAGAAAVLRALYPNETLSQTQIRLTSSGTPVLDTRNNITKPRLNLLAAGRPSNDAFADRASLTGASGNTTGLSTLASKEVGEADHAGNVGGASVWWKWVAPASGQFSLTTSGSAIDTVLAVYQGANASALLPLTANDNELASGSSSRVILQATAGQEYQIAVDGANTSKGAINLAWALNTTAKANLSLNMTGPNAVQLGQTVDYTLTVTNAGPQAATNATISFNVPIGASFVAASTGCSLNASVVSCNAPLLLNGQSEAFIVQLVWNSLSSPVSLSATVSSEVSDTVSTNNASTLQVSLNQSNDAPTLPEWAAILLMLTLFWQNAQSRQAKR